MNRSRRVPVSRTSLVLLALVGVAGIAVGYAVQSEELTRGNWTLTPCPMEANKGKAFLWNSETGEVYYLIGSKMFPAKIQTLDE